jgi:hypothetical protein
VSPFALHSPVQAYRRKVASAGHILREGDQEASPFTTLLAKWRDRLRRFLPSCDAGVPQELRTLSPCSHLTAMRAGSPAVEATRFIAWSLISRPARILIRFCRVLAGYGTPCCVGTELTVPAGDGDQGRGGMNPALGER